MHVFKRGVFGVLKIFLFTHNMVQLKMNLGLACGGAIEYNEGIGSFCNLLAKVYKMWDSPYQTVGPASRFQVSCWLPSGTLSRPGPVEPLQSSRSRSTPESLIGRGALLCYSAIAVDAWSSSIYRICTVNNSHAITSRSHLLMH